MKIVGILCWYDESPSWLANAVCGFGRVCDEIVAVDGAYSMYPGARPRSHPEQAEAILAAAETMGVGCTIHRPKDVFFGQEVEKRNLSLKLAAPLLTPGEDWVMIFDADYQVMLCEDPVYARALLEHTEHNVATYTLLDGHDILANETAAEVCRDVDIDTEWTIRDRGIFRWTDDLRYGPSHFFIRAPTTAGSSGFAALTCTRASLRLTRQTASTSAGTSSSCIGTRSARRCGVTPRLAITRSATRRASRP